MSDNAAVGKQFGLQNWPAEYDKLSDVTADRLVYCQTEIFGPAPVMRLLHGRLVASVQQAHERARMIKQVIWDFNGTILDDVSLCLTIINAMMEKRGLKRLSLADYRDAFDFPVQKYYQSVGFDFDREPFPMLAHEYMDQYLPASLRCGLRDGIPEVLAALDQANVRQVLLSATKSSILLDQVKSLGIDAYFEPILGLDDIFGTSKREMAGRWFGSQAIRAAETVLIGDTTHDDEVARQIGCPSILLTGGHNSQARLRASGARVLDHPAQILAVVL